MGIATRRSKKAKELQMVNLSGRREHRPQKLSAGEQQRVALARALANNPAIILADEPTGHLDPKNKQEIIKLLANLNINRETKIGMVTHDIHVASHTERMLLLSDGKMIKEKQGLHSIKEKQMGSYCNGTIKPDDPVCPSCQKQL